MALLLVMPVCWLVYAALAYRIRQALPEPLFHLMGERLALFSDQYRQNLERGHVAIDFKKKIF